MNYLKPLMYVSLVTSVALFSCRGNNSSSSNENSADTLSQAPMAKNAAQAADQDSETYLLPSPLQIASIYKSAGLTFIPGITAPVKDAGKFNSQFDRALNMGIYSADLSYCIFNKQSDEATKYLDVVKDLSDKLGFGGVFEANAFLTRFKKNISATDSLTSLIAELQMETDTYLENNKQKYIGVIAFAGAWIESMNIGNIVYEKDKSQSVSSRISEQMNILEGLMKLLTRYQSQDSGIPGLIAQLQEVKTAFDSFDEVKSYNPDSDKPLSLTPEHVTQLGKIIQALHDKIVMS